MKSGKTIPFEFVLEQLFAAEPVVKPMFGCYAIYVRNKIVLIVRNRKDFTDDNGVWIATTQEHHASLKPEFPSMRSVKLLGGRITSWQNLPYDSDDFEESVIKACDYILAGDLRIGKVPKPRKKRKAKE
ncbi:MAG TPA: hypothetical protein VIN08_14400 [Ohtaekwangia sp.]|uniref:hypothetical protein n=1 Tax=Ohtaekwangia sp. TaxID=2066019 RepID=UPI002F94B415